MDLPGDAPGVATFAFLSRRGDDGWPALPPPSVGLGGTTRRGGSFAGREGNSQLTGHCCCGVCRWTGDGEALAFTGLTRAGDGKGSFSSHSRVAAARW